MLKRFVKLAICLIFWTIEQGTRVVLSAFGKNYPGTCVVLYYHVVTDEQRERFARQMDLLLGLARPISIENPPEFESGVQYAAITFDDGFRETIEIVLPELKKRNIPITVFVPTGCIGSKPLWIADQTSPHHGGGVLSADEIVSLGSEPGVSFGSHCVSHRPLPTLTDQEAKEEIFRSKANLEDILGRKIDMLSFPHGAFERRHVDWARQAGYARVFSISPVFAFARPGEFVTGRVRVDPTDWLLETRLKTLGAYSWVPLWRGLYKRCRFPHTASIPGNDARGRKNG